MAFISDLVLNLDDKSDSSDIDDVDVDTEKEISGEQLQPPAAATHFAPQYRESLSGASH